MKKGLRKFKIGTPVIVIWRDVVSYETNWDKPERVMECQETGIMASLGFTIGQTKTHFYISPSYHQSTNEFAGATKIPWGTITKIKII